MWVDGAMRDVAAAGLFPRHTHILLMDEAELIRRMHAVTAAFDDAVATDKANGSSNLHFLHAFAVKANPLFAVLKVAKACGFAAETASIGEFRMAERVYAPEEEGLERVPLLPPAGTTAAAPGGFIVFDSPAKTIEELHYALQRRCYLNVDNFAELDRIVDLVDGKIAGFAPIGRVNAVVGIRVNPQSVESTSNTALSTGGKISKFGVALHDPGNKSKLIESYFALHEKVNLRMVHVHSGSQGLSLDTMVAGVRAIVSEIVDEPRLRGIISAVDIGGGFPVDFSTDAETVTVRDYVAALRAAVPSLFASAQPRTIITEFGRAIAAKSGVLISRVEYTKMSGGRQIVLQHVGADLAVRTVWQPEKWPLRVYIYDVQGRNRCAPVLGWKATSTTANGDKRESTETAVPEGFILTDVAGPCCNSGCTLTRAAPLPQSITSLSDLVVVHDTGAYYHSSFCLYNMRQMPACYLRVAGEQASLPTGETKKEGEGNKGRLVCLRPPQPVEDTLSLFM